MQAPVAITDTTFASGSEALSPIMPVSTLLRECLELSFRALRLHADTLDVVRSRRSRLGDVSLRRARLAVLVAGKCGRDLMKTHRALAFTVNHHGVFIDEEEYVTKTIDNASATLEFVRRRLGLGENIYNDLVEDADVNVPANGGRRRLTRKVLSIAGKVLSREAGLNRLLGMATDLESHLWGAFFDTLVHPSKDTDQDATVRLHVLFELEDLYLHVHDLWETIDYLDFWWYRTLDEIITKEFATAPTHESRWLLNVALRVGREIIRGTFRSRRMFWVPCKKVPDILPTENHAHWEDRDTFDEILISISTREVLKSCTTREEVRAYIRSDAFRE